MPILDISRMPFISYMLVLTAERALDNYLWSRCLLFRPDYSFLRSLIWVWNSNKDAYFAYIL